MKATQSQKTYTYQEAQNLVVLDRELLSAMDRVRKIDFTMLRRKLMEDQKWSVEYYDEVEGLYRKFLALNIRYPEKKVCPSGPIDEFWHAHILDTAAYMADCDTLFGGYLHHFPYFGMRGEKDRADLEAAFEESMDLFVVHFGIDPTAGDVHARSCRPQNCV